MALRFRVSLIRSLFSSRMRRCASSTTSYYDSQSGLHVAFSDAVQIHAIAVPPHGGRGSSYSGLASVTRKATAVDIATCGGATIPTAQLTFSEVSTVEELDAIADNQMHVAVDFNCAFPREAWGSSVGLVEAAKARELTVKTTLRHAFSVGTSKVQLAGVLLADAGGDIIMLCDAGDGALDEDILEEVSLFSYYLYETTSGRLVLEQHRSVLRPARRSTRSLRGATLLGYP